MRERGNCEIEVRNAVDGVVGAAELASAHGQVVELFAEVALRASRGQQLAIGVHGRVGLVERDLGLAQLFGHVDLEQARLGDVEALLTIGSGFVGPIGGQPHVFELEANARGHERIGVGHGAHLGGGFVPALESAQGLAFEQPTGGQEVGP